MKLRLKALFVRYRTGILSGILLGLLFSNLWLGFKQGKTTDAILNVTKQIQQQADSDNRAREEARKDSESRNAIIISYLKCISLIQPVDRTPANVQNCVNNSGFIDPQPLTSESSSELTKLSQDPAIVPKSDTPQPQTPAPAGENRPPETSQPSLLDRTIDNVTNFVKGIL